MEGWRVLGASRQPRGEVIVGERKWREAHKNGTEEGSEGKMRPKHSGDDRGVSVAQERRRCKMDSEMSWVHVVAQGDGESLAHRNLPKTD